MQKSGKIPEGHGKFDWISRGSTLKKIDILKTYVSFVLKKPIQVFTFHIIIISLCFYNIDRELSEFFIKTNKIR